MATKKKKEVPTISDVTEQVTKKEVTEYITSGDIGLDLCLSNGQGIPLGANIMLFGLPGTGKTTIFCDIIVRIMRRYSRTYLYQKIQGMCVQNSLVQAQLSM